MRAIDFQNGVKRSHYNWRELSLVAVYPFRFHCLKFGRILGIVIMMSFALRPTVSGAQGDCCKEIETEFGLLQMPEYDIIIATEYGNHVKQAARDYLRLQSVYFLIADSDGTDWRWGDTTSEGLAVYTWKFVKGTIYAAQSPPNEILPHEIGHDIFRRHVIPNTRPDQYGTDAPDWLDEAVAISFELPSDKAGRRCKAGSLLRSGEFLPLDRFLTMDHPSLASIRQRRDPDDVIVYKNKAHEDTPAFYSMALAFSEYLAFQLEDPSILASAAEAYRSGQSLNEWVLAEARQFASASDLSELEADFHGWLARSDHYRCER